MNIVCSICLMLSCSVKKKIENFNDVEYFQFINEAESFILNDDYTSALKYYKKAFNTNTKPIANNCFTAAQVSATCNCLNYFIYFSRKGFENGITFIDLVKDSILKDFIKANNLDLRLNQYYKNDSEVYEKNVDFDLKNKLNKLSNIDNKWKIQYIDSLSSIDNENKILYHRIYDSIVAVIVEKELIPIINDYGFPGERLIGIEKVGNNNNFSFSNNRALFILLHYYSIPRDCRYNELFKKELKKGNLSPAHYASIVDFQNKFGIEKCLENYFCQWHEPENFNINQVNLRRKAIGLDSYKDRIKKIERGKKMCKQIREEKKINIIKLFTWCG
jgi:hypothetical protein